MLSRVGCNSSLSRGLRAFSSSGETVASTLAAEYDIVINGGGVVGAALAARVLQASDGRYKVAIFEQGKIPSLPTAGTPPDLRTYALSPKSIRLLSDLGAWKYIESRSQPYSNMQIWETAGPGVVKFRAQDLGVEELGRICEDRTITAALYQAIRDSGYSLDIIGDKKLASFSLPDAQGGDVGAGVPAVVIKTHSGVEANCRLLIGADGALSTVRQFAGIQSYGWSYGQQAVVGTIKLNLDPTDNGFVAQSIRQTAWQKYLKTGPLAILPLWDGHASVVWSLPTYEAQRVKALSDDDWVAALNDALQEPSEGIFQHQPNSPDGETTATSSGFPPMMSLLWTTVVRREVKSVVETALAAAQLNDPLWFPPSVIGAVSPRVTFPLQLQQAASYAKSRLALVGDAAHSIHPQAGQGLNLGLQDVAALGQLIEDDLAVGNELGQYTSLRKYHNERFAGNLAMLTAVDTIHRVFSDRAGSSENGRVMTFLHDRYMKDAKQAVKSLGMLGLNTVGKPLKNEMAKVAMGLK